MAINIGIPKGTRDFGPEEMFKRNYIFSTIKKNFERYGYLPIETPAFENLSTLMGKYGEEGDRLIFKILNSGNFLENVSIFSKDANTNKLAAEICEKALRYDLTVPLARFVVMHRNEIVFPFKRYQIQPVWRADRPQKGRYREFYQCDVDVIGSDSLLNEIELIQITDAVFHELGIRVVIKVNNRKILAGIADVMGQSELLTEVTVALDKLDKIGKDAVIAEMMAKGISESSVNKLMPVFDITGETSEKINKLSSYLAASEIGKVGIAEISEVLDGLKVLNLNNKIEFDITLARGLNYYTGAIFEVKAVDVAMGSICGGGRYDNLTGIFGLQGISGVGISFGADRIYDVLSELKLFPEDITQSVKVLLVNFGKKEAMHCLELAEKIRKSGISCEVYPDDAKLKKQLSYADSRRIPFAVMVGENEIAEKLYTVKNLKTGEQLKLNLEQLIDLLSA